MKLHKIILPLVCALVAMSATTGCKHTTSPKVTNLPNHGAGVIGQTDNHDQIAPAQPVDMAQTKPMATDQELKGPQPTATFDIHDYTPDPAALAANMVHFKFDSTVVQENEQPNIATVGQALTAEPTAKLLVEGHCDERGTDEYNRALGERRALALREALQKIGIDPMRVKTLSFGKDKPVDDGHEETAWAKNRRGEFILLHAKSLPLASAQP